MSKDLQVCRCNYSLTLLCCWSSFEISSGWIGFDAPVWPVFSWSLTAGEQASLASQTASFPPFFTNRPMTSVCKNGGEEAVWLARIWAGYVDKQQINDNSNNSNGTQLFFVATHHVWSRLLSSSTNDRHDTHEGRSSSGYAISTVRGVASSTSVGVASSTSVDVMRLNGGKGRR